VLYDWDGDGIQLNDISDSPGSVTFVAKVGLSPTTTQSSSSSVSKAERSSYAGTRKQKPCEFPA
jgi:hypothetical protein